MNQKSILHQLLGDLYKESLLSPILKVKAKKIKIIDEIIQITGFKVIPYLLPICLHKNKDLSTYALQNIEVLIQSMAKKHFISLEQSIREIYEYQYSGSFRNWSLLKLEEIHGVVMKHGYNCQLIGLLSCHRNGYIREKAIQLLSSKATGEEFPFLILRLNDHISKVRKLAVQELMKRITLDNVHIILENLFLLQHVKLYAREDFNALYKMIADVLNNPQIIPILIQKMDSDDYYVRRACIKYLLRNPNPIILKKALSHRDFVIRQKASEYIVNQMNLDESSAYYYSIKKDSNMQVRRYAFYLLLKRPLAEIKSEIKNYLLDPHKSIRELATYYTKKLQLSIDVLNLYIGHTENYDLQLASISGIGEVGNYSHKEFIKRFVTDQRIKVRSAAIKSLAKIAGNEEKALYLKLLQDSSKKVSRIATKALMNIFCEESLLFSIYTDNNQTHVKRNILLLLEQLSKVDYIKALFKALYYEPDMKIYIEPKILTWLEGYNRTFYVNFNVEEMQHLKELIFIVKDSLQQRIIEEFELLLK